MQLGDNMEDYSFEIEDAYGNKIIMNAISFIEDQENAKTYMIYTDNTTDEDNILNLYVSEVIRTEDDEFSLEEVEDYEEIDLITKEMDRIIAQNINN